MTKSSRWVAAPLITAMLTGFTTIGQVPEGPSHGIELGVKVGQLKYDTGRLLVQPGERVALRFSNADEMPHNVVICRKGTAIKDIADAAVALGADGLAMQYLPKSDKILAATPLVLQNTSYTLTFTAPKQMGDYPFLCSFPGHYMLMNGILQVGGKLPPPNALSDVNYTYYTGQWNALPDFSQLKPEKTGMLPDNLIDVNVKGFAGDNYGVVFKATLHVPETGEYTIKAGSDDGGRILIDGQAVWEHNGTHPVEIKTVKATLTAGAHPLEIQFFEAGGGNDFVISWSGPGIKEQMWSVSSAGGGGTPILLVAENKPVINRDFYSKAGSRGIAVGYPEGANALFDANRCRWMQLWRGDFVDTAVHWVDRGGGTAKPAGSDVLDLFTADPLAFLTSPEAAWPTSEEFNGDIPGSKSGVRFGGYLLDGKGRPTLLYRLGPAEVSDFLEPVVIDDSPCFRRSVEINAASNLNGLHFFAGRARTIEGKGEGPYRIGDSMTVKFKLTSCDDPVIRPNGDGFDLLIPVKAGQTTAAIEEMIQW